MPTNTITLAKNYTSLLDEVYRTASVTVDLLHLIPPCQGLVQMQINNYLSADQRVRFGRLRSQ